MIATKFDISDPSAVVALGQSIKGWCGVHLDSSKDYLIRNRLVSVANDYDVSTLTDLLNLAKRPGDFAVRDRLIDALTTHETLFFRDQSPFDAIRDHILPELRGRAGDSKPSLRVWSAACSTGQEPYSIAMLLTEALPDLASWSIDIQATDVSAGSIATATAGEYVDHELQRGLTIAQRNRFFQRFGHRWRISTELRQMIKFRVQNLLANNLPTSKYDLILCRNVAIYFTPEDRIELFRNLAQRLAPGGRLIVGCSEVLTGVGDFLKPETVGRSTCYRGI